MIRNLIRVSRGDSKDAMVSYSTTKHQTLSKSSGHTEMKSIDQRSVFPHLCSPLAVRLIADIPAALESRSLAAKFDPGKCSREDDALSHAGIIVKRNPRICANDIWNPAANEVTTQTMCLRRRAQKSQNPSLCSSLGELDVVNVLLH